MLKKFEDWFVVIHSHSLYCTIMLTWLKPVCCCFPDRDTLEKEVTGLRKEREEKESENKELHVAVQSQVMMLKCVFRLWDVSPYHEKGGSQMIHLGIA